MKKLCTPSNGNSGAYDGGPAPTVRHFIPVYRPQVVLTLKADRRVGNSTETRPPQIVIGPHHLDTPVISTSTATVFDNDASLASPLTLPSSLSCLSTTNCIRREDRIRSPRPSSVVVTATTKASREVTRKTSRATRSTSPTWSKVAKGYSPPRATRHIKLPSLKQAIIG